jgi:hypothetical protein
VEVAAWTDKVTGRQCLEPVKEGLGSFVSAKSSGMPVAERQKAIEPMSTDVLQGYTR